MNQSVFSCTYLLFIYLLWWNVWIIYPFSIRLIFFQFWNWRILYQVYDLQIVPPSIWRVFHSLNSIFLEPIFFNYEIQFIDMFFHRSCFVVENGKSLPTPGHRGFCPVFTSESLRVSDFMCRSMIHFELHFIYDSWCGLHCLFMCVHMDSRLLQYLLKRLYFLHWITIALLLNIN